MDDLKTFVPAMDTTACRYIPGSKLRAGDACDVYIPSINDTASINASDFLLQKLNVH
ncbi:MAG TPA: hypothetical protein VK909_09530 [Anaerolineales bacterium]|nr:hypothetical protein [Anaerolineales bacterium]